METSTSARATVFAVGDVFPDAPGGAAGVLRPMTPLLQAADIVFGNCEGVYSDAPAPSPTHKHFMAAGRSSGRGLGEVPFHVMSLGNNHIVDGGYAGLADTRQLLHDEGIATTGAGPTLADALAPAVLERNGVRVAFLSFCTVYPVGYEARPKRPGLAPLRVRTFYADPDPRFWEPGIDPVIVTEPVPEDLEQYRATIAAARERADVVVVANHWGYSSWMEELQDYELRLARDAVEHGADAVVCHHHHSLRGVEIHRGKPIFYGLGTLVHHYTGEPITPQERAARERRFGARSSMVEAEALPLFPFRSQSWRTGVATFAFGADGSVAAGFVPAIMLADGTTEPLRAGDPRAAEVADYLEYLTTSRDLPARFERGERDGWLHLSILPQEA